MPRSSAAAPSTPARIRARILDVFKPIGRKRRARSPKFIHAILSKNHAGNVSIAIQNEDDDAIVITTLDEIPFCCHADLLTMNREQLLVVASALNSKLPAVLEINLQRPDAFIRNSIEVIVGLRSNVPNAPVKAVDPARNRYSPMSPMSPLAQRNRTQVSHISIAGIPVLDVLKEELEEEVEVKEVCKRRDDGSQPPIKKRKIDASPTSTGLHVRRSQSARTATSSVAFPRITRSQSQKLAIGRELPFMSATCFKTSTPKRNNFAISIDPPIKSSVRSNPSSPSLSAARRTKRRRSAISEEDAELTFGIEGMTMLANTSGFDFSMD